MILIDTGYLFPGDLSVHRRARPSGSTSTSRSIQPRISPAWLEARHGRLWEQGVEGIERYNELRKIEPMRAGAARARRAGTWFAGLRREQSASRGRHRAARS